jgi:molecular chaperone DnaK (HSP70)
MIGRRFDDKVIQDEIPRWPFKVVDDDGDIQISVLDELYSPEDISRMVLKRLKENAEKRLNKTIEDVVITVQRSTASGIIQNHTKNRNSQIILTPI